MHMSIFNLFILKMYSLISKYMTHEISGFWILLQLWYWNKASCILNLQTELQIKMCGIMSSQKVDGKESQLSFNSCRIFYCICKMKNIVLRKLNTQKWNVDMKSGLIQNQKQSKLILDSQYHLKEAYTVCSIGYRQHLATSILISCFSLTN